MDPDICNTALKISLQWGPERSTPFKTRLAEARPGISDRDIEALEKQSHEVESAAWGSVVEHMKAHGMKDAPAREAWARPLLAKWPWLDDDNLAMLWTQGCYYAWHDGELT
jgi:hypothetical protein